MAVNEQIGFWVFWRLWFQIAFPCKIISHSVHFYHKFTFTGLMRNKQSRTWRKTSDVTYSTFCSFPLAKSVNPRFHCANFVNIKKLSTRMRLQKQALFQHIKVNAFAWWNQVVFPHVALSRIFSWGFQKQVVDFLMSGFKWNSCSMKPPMVDAHLTSLVFFAQWSVHQTTSKKWEKSLFFAFTCWAQNSACDFCLFFLKGKTASCVMLHIFIYVQPKDEDMMFFRVYFSSQIETSPCFLS